LLCFSVSLSLTVSIPLYVCVPRLSLFPFFSVSLPLSLFLCIFDSICL
jgi:hypothetical protein